MNELALCAGAGGGILGGVSLVSAVKNFPTPQHRDFKGKSQRAGHGNTTDCLPNAIGGQMSADWTEWLMGWPTGWTDLKPLATDRFQQWLRAHGQYYTTV